MKVEAPEVKTLLVDGEKVEAEQPGVTIAQLYVSVDGSVVEVTVPTGAATVPEPLKLYATPNEITKLLVALYVADADHAGYASQSAPTKALPPDATVLLHR